MRNSRRGFTLLELMIVIIIVGVLATLGVLQYQAAIEKSRGAEARQILGQLRTQCAGIYMYDPQTEGASGCTNTALRVGTANDMIANVCRATNFFAYSITAFAKDSFTAKATRCTADGKAPNVGISHTLQLVSNFPNGTDNWTTDGGY